MNTNPPQAPGSASSPVAEFGSFAADKGAGAAGAGEGSACPSPAPNLSFVLVRAMEDVMQARARQIVEFGHTPEADQAKPLSFFAGELHDRARAIREHIQFKKDKAVLRRRAVNLAATALALIDRIDGANPESPDHV